MVIRTSINRIMVEVSCNFMLLFLWFFWLYKFYGTICVIVRYNFVLLIREESKSLFTP